MTKKRTIKNHPAIDPQKPSLVRREALLEELRRAQEAVKPAQQFQDVLKQLQESQKALCQAMKPPQQLQDVTKQ